jgi:hypothetical protein
MQRSEGHVLFLSIYQHLGITTVVDQLQSDPTVRRSGVPYRTWHVDDFNIYHCTHARNKHRTLPREYHGDVQLTPYLPLTA